MAAPQVRRGDADSSRPSKTVVNVTFQGDEWDYDQHVSVGGRQFRLVRVGASGDAAAARDHVQRWSSDADAIAALAHYAAIPQQWVIAIRVHAVQALAGLQLKDVLDSLVGLVAIHSGEGSEDVRAAAVAPRLDRR